MADSINLKRFLDAQDGGTIIDRNRTAYEVALGEILGGEKTSHWIWYIFPQGPFGTSEMARRYAIMSRAEATAFLQNIILRSRLLEITNAVENQLTTGVSPERLMGSEIDCQKLASSITLFEFIAAELDDREFGSSAKNVLNKLDPHGWGRCTTTLDWLNTIRT